MNEVLALRAQTLSDALIDGDRATAAALQTWLMGEVAAGLLHQDAATLMELRAAVADLAPVADHYGQGGPGERWRAVWEILYAIGQTSRPLEQARLARPDSVSGQLLRLMLEEPGIVPSDLAKRLGKRANHVSNALRALIDQGLVFRLPRGKTLRYYLSETGRASVEDRVPVQLANQDRETEPPVPAAGRLKGTLLHLDTGRAGRTMAHGRRYVPRGDSRLTGAGP